MKRHRAPLARAAAAAREVLALRRIVLPEEIDLEALVADHWITLRRAALGNAEGRLVRSGRRGVMTIDERAFESEKWRFVIAHELGHFLLHVRREDLTCFPRKRATRDEKSRSFLDEEAATSFGTTLLMPDAMVLPRYDRAASPMERARALAATFQVSLPTAALRVLDFTDEPCAIAYIERGSVAWCTATKAFGVSVPKGSAVTMLDGTSGAREVSASKWGRGADTVRSLREHSVALSPYDATVTMLWHAAAPAIGDHHAVI